MADVTPNNSMSRTPHKSSAAQKADGPESRKAVDQISDQFSAALDRLFDAEALLRSIVTGLDADEGLHVSSVVRLANVALEKLDGGTTLLDELSVEVRKKLGNA